MLQKVMYENEMTKLIKVLDVLHLQVRKVAARILHEEADLLEDKACYVFLYLIVGLTFFRRIHISISAVIDRFVHSASPKWAILNIVSCYGELCRVGKGAEGLHEAGATAGLVCTSPSSMSKLGYVMVNTTTLHSPFSIRELLFVLLDKLWFSSLGFRVVDPRVASSSTSGMKPGNRVEDQSTRIHLQC